MQKKTLKVLILLLTAIFVFNLFTPAASAGGPSLDDQSVETVQKDSGVSTDLPFDKDKLTDAEQKLSTGLLELTDDKFLPEGVTEGALEKDMQAMGQISAYTPQGSGLSGENVHVYIQLGEGESLEAITPCISKIEDSDTDEGLVAAWVDTSMLITIASLDSVKSIKEVTAPEACTGSVTSEGDSVLKANLARSGMGVDGTGVKVGIISTGARHYNASVLSGDLPSNVHILSNTQYDEGTAMMEIVHDLAPGAELYFHDCGQNVIAFCDAALELAKDGCTVICDDIDWPNQPFFDDGYVANRISSIINKYNVVYCTSAGNSADCHYQGNFAGYIKNGLIDDFSGDGSDPYLYEYVPSGKHFWVAMQWNDKFGYSSNDYDLAIYNTHDMNNPVGLSKNTQNGNGDPLEYIYYVNSSGSEQTIAIEAYAYTSNAAKNGKILEVYTYSDDGAWMYTNNDVPSDSIYGQGALPNVLTCGAVDASEPDTIEEYSSQGPVTTLSGTRNKPDVCGVDNIEITGAGGFGARDGVTDKYYFDGTSAAAPHVAAIAALIKQMFPSLSASQIRDVIKSSAHDLGKAGDDSVYGYGIADALSAVNSYFYVTFDSMGGSSVKKQMVKVGSYASSKTASKRGYSFGGWYTSTDYSDTTKWDFSSDAVTSNMTLYAEWTPKTPSINVKAANYKSVKIYWKAMDNTLGYEVYRYNSETGTYDFLADAGGALSYTDTGLQGGTRYYYKVRGYYTPYSGRVYGSLSPAKSALPVWPSITLKASPSDHDSITLKWNALSQSNGYEVWRSDSANGIYTKIADNVPVNTYNDDGVTTGVRYYYKVRAFDNSSTATLYSSYSSYKYAATVPGVVSGLTLTPLSPNSISLTWSAADGASAYQVYRSTSKNGTYTKVYDDININFNDSGLAAGKTYFYKVRAYCKPGSANAYGDYVKSSLKI